MVRPRNAQFIAAWQRCSVIAAPVEFSVGLPRGSVPYHAPAKRCFGSASTRDKRPRMGGVISTSTNNARWCSAHPPTHIGHPAYARQGCSSLPGPQLRCRLVVRFGVCPPNALAPPGPITYVRGGSTKGSMPCNLARGGAPDLGHAQSFRIAEEREAAYPTRCLCHRRGI